MVLLSQLLAGDHPIPSRTPDAKAGYNLGYLWLCTVVVALGGLLFGWDWVVVGGAKPFFESYFKLTNPSLVGWANSCHLVGCLVGALAAGILSDRFGRKRLLVLAALIFAGTSGGNALATSFSVFITWRILGGVAIGLASSLSPMYISEIAPAEMRGRLVSINQLTLVVGILAAQAIDWYLVQTFPPVPRTISSGDPGWTGGMAMDVRPDRGTLAPFLGGMALSPRARAGWPRTAMPSVPERY